MRRHRDSPMRRRCARTSRTHAAVQAAIADADWRASRPDVQEHPASIARRKRPPARTGAGRQAPRRRRRAAGDLRSRAAGLRDRGQSPLPSPAGGRTGHRSPASVPGTRPDGRSGAQEAPGRPHGPRRASGSPRDGQEAARGARRGAGGAWEAPGGSPSPRRASEAPRTARGRQGRPRRAARGAHRDARRPLSRIGPGQRAGPPDGGMHAPPKRRCQLCI